MIPTKFTNILRNLSQSRLLISLMIAANLFGADQNLPMTPSGAANNIILVDVSGSMRQTLASQDITKIQAVFRELNSLALELDREVSGGPSLLLLGFTRTVKIRYELRPGGGAKAIVDAFLSQAAKIVEMNEATALFNVLNDVLDQTPGVGINFTVLSDGVDNASQGNSLARFLQKAALRKARLQILGLGAEIMQPLRKELQSMPAEFASLVSTAETYNGAGALLPPRILVINSAEPGRVQIVGVGAAATGSTLSWKLDDVARSENNESFLADVKPGEHTIELVATLDSGVSLRASRSFKVDSPKAPETVIVSIAGGEHIAGKRSGFFVSPTGARLVRWSGQGYIEDQKGRGIFILKPGINNIEVDVSWTNGSNSRAAISVFAATSSEILHVEMSEPIVGKPVRVHARLGRKPVNAEISIFPGGMSALGNLDFTPIDSRPYLVMARFDDDGLLYETKTEVHPKFPNFEIKIGAPETVMHGEELVVSAVISGDDLPAEVSWSYEGSNKIGLTASFKATNETGIITRNVVELLVTTTTGRTFRAQKIINLSPRPSRPVASLVLPDEQVRVGERVFFSCGSTGAIHQRTITIDSGAAQLIEKVPFLQFDVAGEHTIQLKVSGPGGDDTRAYRLNISPRLLPPRITRISPFDRMYSGVPVELSATLEGDWKAVWWSVNGNAIGSSTKVTYTPAVSGTQLVEVFAQPASATHPIAKKAFEVFITPKAFQFIYENPRATVGVTSAIIIISLMLISLRKDHTLSGFIKITHDSKSTEFRLKGKKIDLNKQLSELGFDIGSKLVTIEIVKSGEAVLIQDDIVEILIPNRVYKIQDLEIKWQSLVAPN